MRTELYIFRRDFRHHEPDKHDRHVREILETTVYTDRDDFLFHRLLELEPDEERQPIDTEKLADIYRVMRAIFPALSMDVIRDKMSGEINVEPASLIPTLAEVFPQLDFDEWEGIAKDTTTLELYRTVDAFLTAFALERDYLKGIHANVYFAETYSH